ncbi:DUF1800 domain-containing protein [Marinicella sp. S1101]|uniref:DUF1800 domain-containing protein n=1 Tax=Marinicella marina TaxID=2996016 RepID=UPI002260D283|nr:DUF1800 domain-containing protein [Marinicella marina]MCX7552482.1 DUF1800 domain-containing protein [Marinicella marina]MDJ1139358.1 DUF1800 domain-containing protein [Marinicella marina]
MNIFAKKYHPRDAIPSAEKSQSPLKKPRTKPKNSAQNLAQTPTVLGGTIDTPNLTHRVLSKMAFGPSRADINHIESLPGNTETDRILAYIDEQLDPQNISDTTTDNMLMQGFETLNKTQQQFFQEHVHLPNGAEIPWDVHIRPGRETSYAAFIRAINSNRQLFETMTDFWHNHFNVYLEGDNIQPMFVHYDRDVIRPEALGNFRNMMYQVTRSNCMLSYLGNGVNEQSAPNENFARELLELHTIGAKNYYGHLPWQDVPTDNQGRRVGYVEEDVVELARALTGWSFSGASWQDYQYLYPAPGDPVDLSQAPTGTFLFRPDWHDQGVKRVMGTDFLYDSNDPEKDVNDILDMLAEHPATAQFLAYKLCRRFIADEPPQSIVDQVANTLQQNWQASDQIKQAMEVLLKSTEFLNTWGEKIKRPFEKTIAAMRQIEYSFAFNPNEEYSSWHYWGFRNSGQPPFGWTSPNGYPDTKSHWLGASSNMSTWKFIQWICRFRDGNNNDASFNNILAITAEGIPAEADRTANNLVNFWYERACGHPPDVNTQDKLAKFMSYMDVAPDVPIPTDRDTAIDIFHNDWPSYNSERLVSVVSTLFLTAEFSYR